MLRALPLVRPRPICPELEPECLHLPFCDAWRCAVELRRGLTGTLSHCPVCGVGAVAGYRLEARRKP
ncbi:MAG: hypothetical protein M3322_06705 [Actinomycetota bacterium]|nr:hypothetical protein [Actinomycetota bacterium]